MLLLFFCNYILFRIRTYNFLELFIKECNKRTRGNEWQIGKVYKQEWITEDKKFRGLPYRWH